MEQIIYGVDLSLTATGIAALPPSGTIELETITSKPYDPARRLYDITSEVYTRICSAAFVALEYPAVSANRGMAIDRNGLYCMVRDSLYRAGIPYIEVPPTSLKKFVSGKGNVEKNIIIREVFRRWKVEAKDDNQADAAALAYLGAAYIGRIHATDLTVQQREVIDTLRGGPKKARRKREAA